MLELLELLQYFSVFSGVIGLVLRAPHKLWQNIGLQSWKALIVSSSVVSLNRF